MTCCVLRYEQRAIPKRGMLFVFTPFLSLFLRSRRTGVGDLQLLSLRCCLDHMKQVGRSPV